MASAQGRPKPSKVVCEVTIRQSVAGVLGGYGGSLAAADSPKSTKLVSVSAALCSGLWKFCRTYVDECHFLRVLAIGAPRIL